MDRSERSALIERVANSSTFSKSSRLRDLLLHLCEKATRPDDQDLREQTIGSEVFGRPQDYDTASDNIVRSSVFQLRKKLAQYFESEGQNEPVEIVIPRGRYVPEFRTREQQVNEEVGATESPLPPVIATGPSHATYKWAIAVGVMLVTSLACVVFVLWRGGVPVISQSGPFYGFWRSLFNPSQETYIVVADSGFSLLQDVTGQKLTLENYLASPAPPGVGPPELIKRITSRQYTSVADAAIAFRLGALNSRIGGHASIRSGRSLSIRDFKLHNLILLGSSRSNPWTELVEPKLTFQLDYDLSPPQGFIRNRAPRDGELAIYRSTQASTPGDSYGLIAYVPSPEGSGHLLLISGTNMEGTEAAADFLLREANFDQLWQKVKGDDGRLPSSFQAIIRARSLGGAAMQPTLVAWRGSL